MKLPAGGLFRPGAHIFVYNRPVYMVSILLILPVVVSFISSQ